LLGGIGLAVMCLGLLALLTVDRSTPDGVTLAMFAVCGLGFGLFQSPNNRTMISAPRERTGGASGMLGTARLTGQTVGARWWPCSWGVGGAVCAGALPPPWRARLAW
jgi:DHA2 family multidrug resistance protein-like MFS transporter